MKKIRDRRYQESEIPLIESLNKLVVPSHIVPKLDDKVKNKMKQCAMCLIMSEYDHILPQQLYMCLPYVVRVEKFNESTGEFTLSIDVVPCPDTNLPIDVFLNEVHFSLENNYVEVDPKYADLLRKIFTKPAQVFDVDNKQVLSGGDNQSVEADNANRKIAIVTTADKYSYLEIATRKIFIANINTNRCVHVGTKPLSVALNEDRSF